jgi:acyl-CoA thioester hydrolase
VVSARPLPRPRAHFPHFTGITTRWADNDVYGHVNNVTYYAFFDTAVNGFLVANGLLDPETSPAIGLVVETACAYFQPIAFPTPVEIGIVVAELGRSSMRYELGVFAEGAEMTAAHGRFTHVMVDRATRRPVPIPEDWRRVLETIRA